MKILLTGSTGFIGSHLYKRLSIVGHNVAVLVRNKSIRYSESVSYFCGCDNIQEVDRAISQFKPDLVIHLAALYINQHKPEDIDSLIESNIILGTYLLESMKRNRVLKFINFGTRWQHMNDLDYSPANLYAATKEAFQDILLFYYGQGVCFKTIELCDTFGVGDKRKKIIDLMFDACFEKNKIDLSPGEQVLDVVSVEDVCDYLIENIDKEIFFDNQRVSISGTEISLLHLGRIIERITKATGCLNFGGKTYRVNEVMTPPKGNHLVRISKRPLEDDLMIFAAKYRTG